jgi:hypothetical protein
MLGLPLDTSAVGLVPTDCWKEGIVICPVIRLGLATVYKNLLITKQFYYKY